MAIDASPNATYSLTPASPTVALPQLLLLLSLCLRNVVANVMTSIVASDTQTSSEFLLQLYRCTPAATHSLDIIVDVLRDLELASFLSTACRGDLEACMS